MAKEYLDKTGLTYLWGKLKDYFQVKLVSGTNIKTINNTSLLGSGNISISSGGGSTEYDYTTTLTPSIDARGVSAKYFNITPTDSSKVTAANAAKLEAYLVSGSITYPLLVTYASVSGTYFYTHLKSLFGNPQSTTATTISGTLHIVAPFEISNVTAAGM